MHFGRPEVSPGISRANVGAAILRTAHEDEARWPDLSPGRDLTGDAGGRGVSRANVEAAILRFDRDGAGLGRAFFSTAEFGLPSLVKFSHGTDRGLCVVCSRGSGKSSLIGDRCAGPWDRQEVWNV